MSKNRNRAKLNKATTSREYLLIQYDFEYPLYWDEGIPTYPRKKHGWAKSSGKQLFKYQMRMYRTWKYNRRTQWKS